MLSRGECIVWKPYCFSLDMIIIGWVPDSPEILAFENRVRGRYFAVAECQRIWDECICWTMFCKNGTGWRNGDSLRLVGFDCLGWGVDDEVTASRSNGLWRRFGMRGRGILVRRIGRFLLSGWFLCGCWQFFELRRFTDDGFPGRRQDSIVLKLLRFIWPLYSGLHGWIKGEESAGRKEEKRGRKKENKAKKIDLARSELEEEMRRCTSGTASLGCARLM